MSIKRKLKKIIRKFNICKKYPIYIPIYSGDLLKGKNVFITGGAGGLGKAMAKMCLMNGASVVISGRNVDKLKSLCIELKELIISNEQLIDYVCLDMEDVNSFDKRIEEVKCKFIQKEFNVLINNAGIDAGGNIGNTVEEQFDKTLDVNLKGTYFLSQLVSNYFIDNNIKGNILNISSVSGIRPAISPYMISKWGITGMTKGLAKKLIGYDIVVNGIAPGPTATEMLGLDGTDLNYSKAPCKRFLDPYEVANLSVYLISNMGRMIVGETIYITGGCGNLTVDDIEY